MTTIGFIGSGNIGSTLGGHASAATAIEAAAAGDVVVVTVPFKAYQQVPVEPLEGKVVIDTNNYYPQRDGHVVELDEETTTTAELLQAHLPASHVVKCFNNICFKHLATLARPAGSKDRSTLAIAGDDDAGKKTVTNFLDNLGYDTYDVGPLAEGWRFQRDTAAYAQLYSVDSSFEVARSVHAEGLEQRLAESKRYADMD